jgi:hypothetical protein
LEFTLKALFQTLLKPTWSVTVPKIPKFGTVTSPSAWLQVKAEKSPLQVKAEKNSRLKG